MQEVAFLKQNAEKWKHLESLLDSKQPVNPDKLAELFIEITDDLSFSQTFFPRSKTTAYLNGLAGRVHQAIYKNKKEDRSRFITFWKTELPRTFYHSQKELLYAFIFFAASMFIGAFSTAQDDLYVRLILGDRYVNMTEANIAAGDPMAVYKKMHQVDMFLGITFNNVIVSFMVFAMGILLSVGTIFQLFRNGAMVGTFQYFFYQKGLLMESSLTIWIHGTLEISAIIIAGCAGLVMGNSILFPGTYSRLTSFKRGARQGLKIIIGLVPIFIAAGLLESFVTRYTGMPLLLSLFIIISSLTFIVWYFVIYPIQLNRKEEDGDNPLPN